MSELAMTGKEALEYIASSFNIPSLYAMSKALSDDTLQVQPIQLSNYRKGKRMSERVAERIYNTFDIVVTDAYRPGTWRR